MENTSSPDHTHSISQKLRGFLSGHFVVVCHQLAQKGALYIICEGQHAYCQLDCFDTVLI